MTTDVITGPLAFAPLSSEAVRETLVLLAPELMAMVAHEPTDLEAGIARARRELSARGEEDPDVALFTATGRSMLDVSRPDSDGPATRAATAELWARYGRGTPPPLLEFLVTGDPKVLGRETHGGDVQLADLIAPIVCYYAAAAIAAGAQRGDTPELCMARQLFDEVPFSVVYPAGAVGATPGGPDAAPLARSTFGTSFGPRDDVTLDAALADARWLVPLEALDFAESHLVDQVHRVLVTIGSFGSPTRLPRRPVDLLAQLVAAYASAFHLIRIARSGQDKLVIDGPPPLVRTARQQATALGRALDATVFSLPAAAAVDMLESEPPPVDCLRLPFPACAVLFEQPLLLPDELLDWPDTAHAGFAQRRAVLDAQLATIRGAVPDALRCANNADTASLLDGPSPLERLVASGGALDGVVLFEGDPGTVSDAVVWLVHTEGQLTSAIVGLRSHSTLAPALSNLAAALTYGPWAADLPPNPDGSSPLSASAQRRALRAGRVPGVYCLDMAAAYRRSPALANDADAGPVLAEHRRRGHWHRYRTGPRHDWQYELRWIAPLVVNAGTRTAGPQPRRVYRMPMAR